MGRAGGRGEQVQRHARHRRLRHAGARRLSSAPSPRQTGTLFVSSLKGYMSWRTERAARPSPSALCRTRLYRWGCGSSLRTGCGSPACRGAHAETRPRVLACLFLVSGQRALSHRPWKSDSQPRAFSLRWVLRCHACTAVSRQLERHFCDRCGNATMDRVVLTVDGEGVEHVGVRRRHRLRGTRYSLPNPKGGRYAINPILREDQLAMKRAPSKGNRRGPQDDDDGVFAVEFNEDKLFERSGNAPPLTNAGKAPIVGARWVARGVRTVEAAALGLSLSLAKDARLTICVHP